MYSMPQMTTCGPRKRRPRTTVQQLAILQDSYLLDPMPCSSHRQLLSEIVGLSSRSIQIWFQNRRQKLKTDAETQEMVQQRKEQALKILNTAFDQNSTPSESELEALSQEIGISTKCIHVWFQNKLAKQKIEDQFAIKKKPASLTDLSPSYFRPQQRSEPPQITPSKVNSEQYPFTQTMPMMMPMLDLQLYPAYQDPQMMDYSFYDDQVSCWNPLTMFSQKTNHQVLEQPLFDTAMTPEEIMKDFTL